MTILFVLASPEYLRFFDSTIALLAERGHRLHVVFNEAAEYKPVGVGGASALPLAGVDVIPGARTFWADTATAYRAVVDFLRFLHPDFAGAPVLRERIRRKVLPVACRGLDRIKRLPAGVLDAVLTALRTGERALPVDPRVDRAVAATHPDLVVVSPLVDAASAQVDWIKAARARGIPSALAVASWDNLTNKGLMRIPPDRVFVWNAIQRREATRYHAVSDDQVVVTGAPVFDRWFDRQPSRSRGEFCRAAGLRDDRPFVLFTGSSAFIANGEEEVAFVGRWLRALRAAADPHVREAAVIVRPHPYNATAWTHADLGDAAAAVWPRGAFNPAAEAGRQDLFDSLYHAAAIVGINTTVMIEAAIVGRPVLTVTEFPTQQGTLHFHYLLRENGGVVTQSSALDEHVAQLATALVQDTPGAAAAFVESFVRPQGMTEPSAPRLASAIEAAATMRPARRPAGAAVLLRPAMGAFGVWVATVARLTSDDPYGPVRKHVLHPLRVGRRRSERYAERVRERTARTARLASDRLRRVEHVARARIRRLPNVWKGCRRALRQARYTVGMWRRGEFSARTGK